MTPPATPAIRERKRWKQLPLSRKLCILGVLLLLVVIGLEGVARLYWFWSKGVGHISPEAIWRTNYSEIASSGIDDVAPYHGDDSFDVLLLGASVLHHSCGDIAPRLRERLAAKLACPVRVINFAYPGRTSAESRAKYARLENRRFDLVLVYHAINDAYLNNCPPDEFRADYTHIPHFAQVMALDRHPEVSWFVLPYTIEHVAINLGNRWHITRGNWELEYGSNLRTPPLFEANLEAIADLAERRGDPLLLATFAYHLPANYTEEAFKAKQLDYAKHGCPASTWGTPANLTRALDAHNAAIRRVAQHRDTLFVDVAGRLPRGRACFDDPCHLTPEGCRQFVEMIVDGLDRARLGNRDSCSRPIR